MLPDGVVSIAGHNKPVAVLEAGDAPLVAV